MALKVVPVLHVRKTVFNAQQVQTVYHAQQVLLNSVEIVLNVYQDVVYVIKIIMFNVLNAMMDIICKDKAIVSYAQLDVKHALMHPRVKLVVLDISIVIIFAMKHAFIHVIHVLMANLLLVNSVFLDIIKMEILVKLILHVMEHQLVHHVQEHIIFQVESAKNVKQIIQLV